MWRAGFALVKSGLAYAAGGNLIGMGSSAVVIPCFNDGEMLESAVGSAEAQEVAPEIVVVDDGTTDPATRALLRRLNGRGIHVIQQPNQGPAPARMAGVRATDADYVFALDADDMLAPGGLRRLGEVLDRHPEAAAAWGAVQTFGEVEYVGDRSPPSLDPWEITFQNHLPIGSLYRRSALLDVGGWQFPGGYEDWDLWMSLAERGWKGIGIPEVTAFYRVQRGRRLSRSSRRHAERYVKLRARHPVLFAERRRNWRSSRAPMMLKLVLPAIEALPVRSSRKRMIGSAVAHVAYGNGWGVLVSRYRAHRVLRAA
jgi:glycosyltransferase involved in cell wall biosynthesis